MDRIGCITKFISAGMTWWGATCLFHESIAWRPESERQFWVEHYEMLADEDRRLREEK